MNFNKYNNHTTVAELLADEYFISSILDPTKESEEFWQQLLQENNLSEHSYQVAKDKLLSKPKPMDPLRKVELFIRIQDARVKRPNIFYYSRYVAAVLLLTVCISLWLFVQKSTSLSAIENEVVEHKDSVGIRLVTNGNQTLNIVGKEAELDFSDDEVVKLNTETIDLIEEEEAIQHEVYVPVGKRMSLVLPDGTKLWVNAGSSVIFPSHFAGNKREVQVNGEVYADVVKDAKRPFVFHTKEFDVQVLGTSLNIHAYEKDNVQLVTLVEGKVRVESSNGEHYLTPNQAYFKYSDQEQVRNVDVSYNISWKDGFYRFKNQPLQDVINNLERYYGTEIQFDPKISNLRCSGNLDLQEDITAVVQGVAYSMNLKMKKENNIYKLYQ